MCFNKESRRLNVSQIHPLQTGRFYKVKNPRKSFLCALCSAPRSMKYSKNLSGKNYLQILIVSICLSWLLYPVMGVRAVLLIFPLWMIAEVINKLLYRKELPCPYCGFDATWYRRDVTIAQRKVKEFWRDNFPEIDNKEQQPLHSQKVADAIVNQQQQESLDVTQSQDQVI